MKILIVVDVQNDFVDGALGSPEAQAIIPNIVKKIEAAEGPICVTFDTHGADYLHTQEGQRLPVTHCFYGSQGWNLNADVEAALSESDNTQCNVYKNAFCASAVIECVQEMRKLDIDPDVHIELVGLCTDICVVSCALALKAMLPRKYTFSVDAACCAGTTPENHIAALKTMKSCQIDIINAPEGV